MNSILTEIAAYKKNEVALRKERYPVAKLMNEAETFASRNSLKNKLINTNTPSIIAEFKPKSPTAGVINSQASAADIVKKYSVAGAAAISVLTDNHFFGSSFENFRQARRAAEIPLLQKDFIVDIYQVYEAAALGADVILLIAALLDKAAIKEMSALCHDLGMECILEVHSEDELDKISPDINIIGVNNRDLKTFEVDIMRSVKLSELIPSDKVRIAESGISSPTDLLMLYNAGYKGFLIGTGFMNRPDPGKSCSEFIRSVNSLLQA